MKKSDLKDGMIVELRNGDVCIVIGEKMLDSRGHQNFNSYDEDLISHKHSAFDVIKIYEDKSIDCLCDIYINSRLKMLWQRAEIDWSKVPVGTRVRVWDEYDTYVEGEGLFLEYVENDINYPFRAYVKDNDFNYWSNCELAEQPKEEVTLKELENKYDDFEDVECGECSYCKYKESNVCEFAWILDNYNVTRK